MSTIPILYFRIIPILKGRDLRLDFNAWMDLAYGGVSEENIIRFFKQCEVPAWILPIGAPFRRSRVITLMRHYFRTAFATCF